jgi:hypothetical protein
MHLPILLIAFFALVFQPATITITDCLLQGGYSRAVPQTPITTLAGVDGWVNGNGERVLTEGAFIGFTRIEDSDGAERLLGWYAYSGAIYVFVFKDERDPGRRLPGDPDGTWHGDCLLRVEGG